MENNMKEKLRELVEIAKANKNITDEGMTPAEKLRYRAMFVARTDAEWLQLQKDIREFVKTKPTEEEKKILYSFGEMVSMTCSAIEEKAKQSAAIESQ